MEFPDGWKRIFAQWDGSLGSSRKIFLTHLVDPHGNAMTLTYDSDLRVVAVVDAIGQVTTIAYENPNDIYKITKVTDPFGRSATFDYAPYGRLIKITDVIGLESQFTYEGLADFINALVTPYGTNTFIRGENGTTRWLEIVFPDGERDRVEYNQSTTLGTPVSVPPALLPLGMNTHNDYLWFRNTYYWSLGIAPDNGLVEVASRRGKVNVKAKTCDRLPPGIVFMTFHFKEAAVNLLTLDALDPVAKIPGYKVCAVRIQKIP